MSGMKKEMKEAVDEFSMHFYDNRLETFKDWPFQENCKCTPDKLAAAGFVYCGTEKEPDLVKCYVCLKELDGWEPEDEPWKEHVGHSGACPFLRFNNINDVTLKEFIELDKMRAIKRFRAEYVAKKNEVQEKL